MAKKKENEIVVAQPTALTPIEQQEREFDFLVKKATMIANSSLPPDAFRGEMNIGNVIIAMEMADRLHMGLMMVMQNLNIIYGKPSFSSPFLIAAVNLSGRFTPLMYEYRERNIKAKDGSVLLDKGYRAYAFDKDDKERKYPLYGSWVTTTMAKLEGWYDKKGSKWQTMPEQMLKYRAAAFWQRTYAPEVTMCVQTEEDNIDAFAPTKSKGNSFNSEIEAFKKRANADNSAVFEEFVPDVQTTADDQKTQHSENS